MQAFRHDAEIAAAHSTVPEITYSGCSSPAAVLRLFSGTVVLAVMCSALSAKSSSVTLGILLNNTRRGCRGYASSAGGSRCRTGLWEFGHTSRVSMVAELKITPIRFCGNGGGGNSIQAAPLLVVKVVCHICQKQVNMWGVSLKLTE